MDDKEICIWKSIENLIKEYFDKRQISADFQILFESVEAKSTTAIENHTDS